MSFFNFLADFMDDLLDWKYSPVRAAILFLLFLLITVTVPISFYEATLPESELFFYPLFLKIFEYKFGEGGYYAVLNVVKTVITIIPVFLVSQVEESVFRIRSVFGLSCDSTFRKVFSYAYLVIAILVAFSFVLYLLKKIFGNSFLGRAATRRLEKENEHSAQKEAKRQAKQRAAQAEIRAVKDAARQEMIEKISIPHIEVDPDSYRLWKTTDMFWMRCGSGQARAISTVRKVNICGSCLRMGIKSRKTHSTRSSRCLVPRRSYVPYPSHSSPGISALM